MKRFRFTSPLLFCVWSLFCLSTSATAQDNLTQLTDLPTVYIYTFEGKSITSKTEYIYADLYYVYEDEVTMYDSIQIRGRGNSTWNLAKKPYRIKFKQKEKFLGKERANAKSWTLLANFADKTLIRNSVASCIGTFAGQPFTPAAQFCDLVLNDEYLGNYQISDQIEVRKKRVHITEQDEVLTDDSDITGGYLVEVDGFATGEPVYFRTAKNIMITIKSPDDEVIVSRQKEYIKDYFQQFEDALFSADFTHRDNGYRPFVDSLTLASWYISTELTGNVDGFWSTYMYKEQGDPHLYWGPMWDYDIAFNNCNRVGDVSQELMINKGFGSDLTKVWMLQMWKDPWFVHLIDRTWKECIARGFEEHVMNHIDSMATLIDRSQTLNFEKWRINQRVYNEITLYSTYLEGVEYLKSFLTTHFDYLTRTFEEAADNIGIVEEPTPEFVVDETFYYRISNKGNGYSIDLTDEASESVCVWAPDYERKTQLWEIMTADAGYYHLINAQTGMAITDCASYSSGTYVTGSQLAQKVLEADNLRQQWMFVPVNTGNSYVIVNRETNLAMNNAGGKTVNGNGVLSWKNDADNPSKNTRQWRIEREESKPVDDIEQPQVHLTEYAVLYNPETQHIRFVAEDMMSLLGTAHIYSAGGARLMSFAVTEGADVSSLAPGIYILQWMECGRVHSVKFIKRG